MPENKKDKDQVKEEILEKIKKGWVYIFLAGVMFALLTLLVELLWSPSAEFYIDPIPTFFHILLVGFVPLANFQLLWSLYKGNFERKTLIGWTSAISAGIGLVYSLIFLPVIHISFIGIIVGLGILGFAPMVVFGMTLLMRSFYRKATSSQGFIFNWRGVIVGFFIALIIVGLSEARILTTKFGLDLTSSSKVENQKRGLEILQKFGDNGYLLDLSQTNKSNLCISDNLYSLFTGKENSFFSFLSQDLNSRKKAKEVFYRLNGETTSSYGSRINSSLDFSRWEDKNLFLISSEMVGSIDNEASLGYLEWTFEFENISKFAQSEAIGLIQMPEDSVVSRLTLWVNGEEREAAFAERKKVTEAYEKVVSSRRDPVLVTTSGKDRIDMKCFPVQPKGGKMKAKIGFTFPLILHDKKSGLLKLPYFIEDNFKISSDFKHKIRILSTGKLETNFKDVSFEPEDRFFVLKGNVLNTSLVNSSNLGIKALRTDENSDVWGYYDNTYIKQEIIQTTIDKPARFVFVIDTSGKLKAKKEKIISAIKSLPKDLEIGLVLTHGNGKNQDISNPKSFIGNSFQLAEKLKLAEFGGGTDNLPALVKAWDLAKQADNGIVIWIHSPQSFLFSGSAIQADKLARRSNQTQIYNVSIGKGKDVIEEKLEKLNFLKNVARYGDLKGDLGKLIKNLNKQKGGFQYSRTIDTEARETVEKKTSKHMIRLWAFEEVNEILATEKDEKGAIDLALKYQLVTPVTGAVVLETQEQYDEAGLKPVKKNVVHAVPEPETYILMLIGLGLVIWTIKRHRSVV